MIKRVEIECGQRLVPNQNRLDFRAEVEPIPDDRVVQWLDADAISRQEQRPVTAVPQGNREHATKHRERLLAPLLVGVDNRLGVARGGESMTACREIRAECHVVVDFAVEDDPDGAALVGDGLLSRGHIDNGQTPHAEGNPVFDVDPLVIWATMSDCGAHAPHQSAIPRGHVRPACPAASHVAGAAGDPAHIVFRRSACQMGLGWGCTGRGHAVQVRCRGQRPLIPAPGSLRLTAHRWSAGHARPHRENGRRLGRG